MLTSPASRIATSQRVVGGLGTLPGRGCRWALGNETWCLDGLFITPAPAGCQALSGVGQIAVNKTDAGPALGEQGILVREMDENCVNRKGNFADDKDDRKCDRQD